jgi:ribosomal protein S18 acetylase RimI-like enzyme
MIRPANLRNIRDESRRLREIYNQAWEKNWGFVPFTEAEIEFMTKELKPLLVPEFAWIAEIGNEPVGFTLCLPNINVALRQINGRLTRFGFPIGLIKLLFHKRRIRTARLIALGVIEKYRRAGIAEMLVLRVMEETMVKRGITGELSMTLEDNFMINRFLEAIGAQRYKTYRIYSKSIT